jgi:hypothetical protein
MGIYRVRLTASLLDLGKVELAVTVGQRALQEIELSRLLFTTKP